MCIGVRFDGVVFFFCFYWQAKVCRRYLGMCIGVRFDGVVFFSYVFSGK